MSFSDGEILVMPPEALVGRWCVEYNGVRPHSRLGYRPLAPEVYCTAALWPRTAVGGSDRSRWLAMELLYSSVSRRVTINVIVAPVTVPRGGFERVWSTLPLHLLRIEVPC